MRESHGEPWVTAVQKLGVTAGVTIIPTVACGPLQVTCESSGIRPAGPGDRSKARPKQKAECRLIVYQELSVALPLSFGAETECRLDGVYSAEPAAPQG